MITSDAPPAFPLGQTPVTFTATDEAGNKATCQVMVIVEGQDRTPPEVTCPGDILVECSSPDGAVVEFAAAAQDACDPAPAIRFDPASGSLFPPGATVVTCTAADASGNESQCRFEVQVTCGGQLPGDCNQDGLLDISDALCILGFLFLGKPEALPCGDGTSADPGNLGLIDWNGDTSIDLSDAVGPLNWLFTGGKAHVLGEVCRRMDGCPPACNLAR